MNNNRRLLIALPLAAIIITGVVLYFRSASTQILPGSRQTENQPTPPSKPQVTAIALTDYSAAQWDKRSPDIAYQNLNPVNIRMAETGFIRYTIDLPDQKTTGSISAIMSSELLTPQQQSDDPNLTSDVTLFVNGKEQGTQNVIKDTGQSSQRYNFNVSSFQKGENLIEFHVKKNAPHPHGLTIWSPILVDFR